MACGFATAPEFRPSIRVSQSSGSTRMAGRAQAFRCRTGILGPNFSLNQPMSKPPTSQTTQQAQHSRTAMRTLAHASPTRGRQTPRARASYFASAGWDWKIIWGRIGSLLSWVTQGQGRARCFAFLRLIFFQTHQNSLSREIAIGI
jgi:hypothetical protein